MVNTFDDDTYYAELLYTLQNPTLQNIEKFTGGKYSSLKNAQAQMRPYKGAIRYKEDIERERGVFIREPTYEILKTVYKEDAQIPSSYKNAQNIIQQRTQQKTQQIQDTKTKLADKKQIVPSKQLKQQKLFKEKVIRGSIPEIRSQIQDHTFTFTSSAKSDSKIQKRLAYIIKPDKLKNIEIRVHDTHIDRAIQVNQYYVELNLLKPALRKKKDGGRLMGKVRLTSYINGLLKDIVKSLPLKDGKIYQVYYSFDSKERSGGFTSGNIKEDTVEALIDAIWHGKKYKDNNQDYELKGILDVLERVFEYELMKNRFTGMDFKITELDIQDIETSETRDKSIYPFTESEQANA